MNAKEILEEVDETILEVTGKVIDTNRENALYSFGIDYLTGYLGTFYPEQYYRFSKYAKITH